MAQKFTNRCLSQMILLAFVLASALADYSRYNYFDRPPNAAEFPYSAPSNAIHDICPSKRRGLVPLPPGPEIHLNDNVAYIIDRSISVTSITITNGASLTVLDDRRRPIFISLRYLLIGDGGTLQIGSEECPHTARLDIELRGRTDEPVDSPTFGRKFIAAESGGSIEIHGPWKLSWTYLSTTIKPNSEYAIVTLRDSHRGSWGAGDRIVVASTDYDMEHAEEFDLMQCHECRDNQIKIRGPARFTHLAVTVAGGVRMAAEVGILTRNIKIHGEMEKECREPNKCQFFDYDTFGGHIMVAHKIKVALFEGIELYHMGQQFTIGRYPIHYHMVSNGGYGNYAKQLSIHHCFSRCVTVHSTNGVLVEDVVGYDTLGHCFFLEDGNERDNRLNYNLGLVTRPGTLLPSDRDEKMCLALTANSTVHVPEPNKECKSVSTYWITHPANYLTNNSAAGSMSYGFFFLFHRVPTGPSAGSLPPFHGERSPLGSFVGNMAHANLFAGFAMGRGVKVDPPSAEDPRDFLAVIDLERYQPHVDRDLSLPRAPAIIFGLTGYANKFGVLVKGGDIWIHNAMLSDNDVAVQMSSDQSLPYDQGSHQEVKNSVIVGRSAAVAGWKERDVPCVGVEIRDGPVVIECNKFYNFPDDSRRRSYAIGFKPQNPGQNSPANAVKLSEYFAVEKILFFGEIGGRSGSYFGNYDLDGDLTQIVKIVDSTDVKHGLWRGHAVRADYPLLSNDRSCAAYDTFKLCEDKRFGQLYVNVTSKDVKMAIRDITSHSKQLILRGVDRDDNQHPTTLQFQPVLKADHTYRINWLEGVAPNSVNFSLHNFAMGDFVQLEILYPPGTVLRNVGIYLLDQISDTVTQLTWLRMSASPLAFKRTGQEAQYFWDRTSCVLYLRLEATWMPDGYSYCAKDGCHFVNADVAYYGHNSYGPKFY